MDQAHQQTDRELKQLEKRLAKTYGQAATELQAKFEDYMRRFAIKDEIKRKQVASGELSQEEYIKWRYGQICIGKRWEEMVKTMTEDLVNVDQIAMSMVNDFTPDVYALNHNYGTFEAESGSMIDTSYTLYDRDTVNYLLTEEPDLLPRPKVDIPKDMAWNKKHITSAITQGILQGESIPQISKRLTDTVGMDHRAAVRSARTATTGAENKGRIDSYKRAEKMGIKIKKTWLATLDGRTRHAHRYMDGQKQDTDKPFKSDLGTIMYPGDPHAHPANVYNCRCTLIAQVQNQDVDASDLSDRNTRKLGGMSYDEWKASKPGPSKAKKKTKPDKPATETAKKAKPQKPKTYPDTFEGKIARIQDRVKANGSASEDDLKEAGKLIAKKRKDDRASRLAQAEMIKKERDKIFDSIMDYPAGSKDRENAIEKWKKLDADCAKSKLNPSKMDNAQDLKQVLSSIREMGSGGQDINKHLGNSKSKVAQSVKDAYDIYPSDWVKKSVDMGNLHPQKVKRGYYNGVTIAISAEGESAFKTAIHELGHRMEDAVPGIKQSEKDFYDRRTKGEELKWLGRPYGKNEKARKDDFINPYMGKDYGGDGYELVSMGFEMAYTRPELLAKDPDMESWIYGILALM